MRYMQLSRERQGEVLILFEAFLWAFFPVITILSYASLAPLAALIGSLIFAGGFFALALSFKKKWHEVRNVSALKDIVVVTICIGVLYYSFVFFGLQTTSAGNVSILLLMEIFFTFSLFRLWSKQTLILREIIGALCMVVSALIVLFPKFSGFTHGDLFIIAATVVAPIGNYFQQQARTKVSSETILFLRTVMTFPFLIALAYVLGVSLSTDMFRTSLPFLLVNGILLLGFSKILWIEAINRISVPKALSLNSIGPIFTLAIAWAVLHQIPTSAQLLAIIPMIIGVLLLTTKSMAISKVHS